MRVSASRIASAVLCVARIDIIDPISSGVSRYPGQRRFDEILARSPLRIYRQRKFDIDEISLICLSSLVFEKGGSYFRFFFALTDEFNEYFQFSFEYTFNT